MNLRSFIDTVKNTHSFFSGARSIGVDLGTHTTRIAIPERGIVLREPTFIGQNSKNNEYIFFGKDAKDIYGKAPNFISIIKPMENSIISDFDSTVVLVTKFFQKAVYPYFLRNQLFRRSFVVYTAVTSSATEVERRAVEEAFVKAGAARVVIIDKTVAAAAGAELSVFSNTPLFVVDCGAGLVEIAIIIMGGIVASKSLKLGGEHMNKLIYNYLHLKYGIITGEPTCEVLKIKLLTLSGEKKVMTVRGKSLENGLPKSVRVTTSDIREALAVNLNQIIDGIKELLEMVPPEVIDGIIKNGLILTGGLANIDGIDKYIMQEIKIPVAIHEKPEDATIRGTLNLLSKKSQLDSIIAK